MKTDCALYRAEKHNDDGIMWLNEYCDGLEEAVCKTKACPFYKSKEIWRAIVIHKQTQYVRFEE